MTKYLIDSETLTDIADAIRDQTGDSSPIEVAQMAAEIASIQGGAVNYSTTEHEVGTWVDGSTLYEISIPIAVDRSSPNSYDVPTGLDLIVSMVGVAYTGGISGNVAPLGYYVSSNDRFIAYYDSTTKKIKVSESGSWAANTVGYITIKYTKATT